MILHQLASPMTQTSIAEIMGDKLLVGAPFLLPGKPLLTGHCRPALHAGANAPEWLKRWSPVDPRIQVREAAVALTGV